MKPKRKPPPPTQDKRPFEEKAARLASYWGEGVSFQGPNMTSSLYATKLIESIEKRWVLLNYATSGRTLAIHEVQKKLRRPFTSDSIEPRFLRRPTARDIYDDLLSLREEFEDIYIHLDTRPGVPTPFPLYTYHRRSVTVVTAPVTLNDTYLGPFRLTLPEPDRDLGSHTYDIHATPCEPNVVEKDDCYYCHPHIDGGVDGSSICYGDAGVHVEMCLHSGLIYDTLVCASTVLHSYGASNPYCDLSYWDGDHEATPICSHPNCDYNTRDVCDHCSTPLCDLHRNIFDNDTVILWLCNSCYTKRKEADVEKAEASKTNAA